LKRDGPKCDLLNLNSNAWGKNVNHQRRKITGWDGCWEGKAGRTLTYHWLLRLRGGQNVGHAGTRTDD